MIYKKSDIDFVVVMDETPFDPLSLLANQLISHSVCEQSEIKLIYSASVPIIKLIHSKSKLPVFYFYLSIVSYIIN